MSSVLLFTAYNWLFVGFGIRSQQFSSVKMTYITKNCTNDSRNSDLIKSPNEFNNYVESGIENGKRVEERNEYETKKKKIGAKIHAFNCDTLVCTIRGVQESYCADRTNI